MKKDVPKKCMKSTHLQNHPVMVSKKTHTSYELHWHDFFEIEIILDGSGTQILNGREYKIKKGQVSFITTTDFHEFITDTQYSQYNVRIREDVIPEKILEKLISLNDNIVCYFDGESFRKIVYLAELARLETDPSDEEYLRHIVECMLILILRNFKKTGVKATQPSKMLIHKASLYMRMHFREPLQLNQIAKYVNLNSSYFCRFFTSEIGISPKKFLSDLRLSYAVKLLTTTSASVTEICFASGYTSVSNFLKSFKSSYNMTPKQMRDKHTNPESAYSES